MIITEGKKVSIEYTLTLDSKEVIDTNVNDEPLIYVHGSNQIIPGLEKGLEGLKVGDIKKVAVKPEDGYGPVMQEAFFEVRKDQLPPDAWEVGKQVQGQGPDGQVVSGKITEVMDDKAIIDLNHPLAGKEIFFEIKVLDIQ